MEAVRFTARLPEAAIAFLDKEAKKTLTSRNAQLVRCVLELMNREDQNEKSGAQA